MVTKRKDYELIKSITDGISFPKGITKDEINKYIDICFDVFGSVPRDYQWAIQTEQYKNKKWKK